MLSLLPRTTWERSWMAFHVLASAAIAAGLVVYVDRWLLGADSLGALAFQILMVLPAILFGVLLSGFFLPPIAFTRVTFKTLFAILTGSDAEARISMGWAMPISERLFRLLVPLARRRNLRMTVETLYLFGMAPCASGVMVTLARRQWTADGLVPTDSEIRWRISQWLNAGREKSGFTIEQALGWSPEEFEEWEEDETRIPQRPLPPWTRPGNLR